MTRLNQAINLRDFYRYILIYGPGVGDIFFQNNGDQTDFLHCLTDDLQRKGYQRILHLSPTKPVHLLDPISEQLAENHLWNYRNEVLTTGIVQELKLGPFGQTLPEKKDTYQSPARDGLGDVNGIRLVDQMIKEKSSFRTALVIYNSEVFLDNFSNPRILGGIFSEWLQLPIDNQNSIFFVFTNTDLEELTETIKKSKTPELKGLLDNQNMMTVPQFRIGGPDKDEISGLINFLEVKHNITFHIPNFNLFVKWLVSERVLLRTWNDRFSYLKDVNIDIVRKNGWFSTSKGDIRSFEEKLGDFIGLQAVKDRILELRDWMNFQENENNSSDSQNLHMVFYGNPGTGKTSLARLMGEMFHEYGVLERGHLIEVKGSDLIADVVGGTAVKTNRVINTALDGLLFIDEAYSLSSKERGGFGQEALETLLVRMENDRNRLVVILAGYPNKMREFLASNPGLNRRFQAENRFEFPDFTPNELEIILQVELQKRHLQCDQEFNQNIQKIISKMMINQEGFGNAGEIRNLVDSLERKSKARAFNEKHIAPVVSMMDLPLKYQERGGLVQPEEILNEFDSFVGLTPVRSYLTSMVNLIRLGQIRYVNNMMNKPETILENYIFTGNPGTGKTTIARMIGRIYKSLGLLQRGHTIEVSAANLVAGYVGQTYEKTKEVLLNAIDGVLFIDEAYALTRNQGFSSAGYCLETIDILVKYMEDYRDRLVIIAAGYPDEMMNFLTANPGLKSRFGTVLLFEDFNQDELGQIFVNMITTEGFECNQGTINLVVGILEEVRRQNPKNFGNAREVRKIFSYMKRKLADRVFTNGAKTPAQLNNFEELNVFQPDDAVGFNLNGQQDNSYPYFLPQQLIPKRSR